MRLNEFLEVLKWVLLAGAIAALVSGVSAVREARAAATPAAAIGWPVPA